MADQARIVKGLPAPTPQQIADARELTNHAGQNLATIRQSATSWRNAGLVSAGVSVAASVLAGPELVTAVPDGTRTAILVALAMTYALGVAALAASVRASIGWPTFVRASTPSAKRDWERTETRKALRCLQASMILTLCAAAAAAVTVGVALGADRTSDVVEVSTASTSVCGSLVTESAMDLTLNVAGVKAVVPRADVVKLVQLPSCR